MKYWIEYWSRWYQDPTLYSNAYRADPNGHVIRDTHFSAITAALNG